MVAAAASKTSKVTKTSSSYHPPFAKMIIEAIAALKEKGGSSRQAILKYIKSHYKVDEKVAEINVRRVLVSATAAGKLIRVKGTGASGSFKVAQEGEKAAVKAKSAKRKAKEATADKPKKVATSKKIASPKISKAAPKPKKPTSPKAKKSHVKKAPKKPAVAAAAKKPKVMKAKKPAAKKTSKRAGAAAKE